MPEREDLKKSGIFEQLRNLACEITMELAMERKYLFIPLLFCIFLLGGCTGIHKTVEREREFFRSEASRKKIITEVAEEHEDFLEENIKESLLMGEIPVGINKNLVVEILSEPTVRYVSDCNMAEIWFYEECYVGFGRDDTVIRFRLWNPDGEKQQILLP